MKFISCLVFFILVCSCATSNVALIKSGDLLFIEAQTDHLSGAISRVTRSDSTLSYDHVALIEKHNCEIYILHAAPKKGSEKIKFKTFIKEFKKQHRQIDVYRLKRNYESCIQSVISEANKLLGKPYNITYVPNETKIYCSDFIERSFRDCHIFTLKPMRFKNPNTGKTDVYWEQFYKEKQTPIPEGEPGTNPNDLSKSTKIEKLFRLN